MMSINIHDTEGFELYKDINFSSYNIVKSLDFISDSFTFTFYPVEKQVLKAGYWCIFFLDSSVFFYGLINTVVYNYSKQGTEITVSGNTKTSILERCFCSKFEEFNKIGTKDEDVVTVGVIITDLYNQSPCSHVLYVPAPQIYDSDSDSEEIESEIIKQYKEYKKIYTSKLFKLSLDPDFITYEDDLLRAAKKTKAGKNYTIKKFAVNLKVEMGDKIWDKINVILSETGFDAWFDTQTNTLIIGKIKNDRMNKSTYVLDKSNVLEISEIDDQSDVYSAFRLTGTKGFDYGIDTKTHRHVDRFVKSARIYLDYYEENNNYILLDRIADKYVEEQEKRMFQSIVKIQGHYAPDNKPWDINRYINFVLLSLRELNLRSKYYINSIEFNYNRDDGTTTYLTVVREFSNSVNPDLMDKKGTS